MNDTENLKQNLLQRIAKLPEFKLKEIMDFIDSFKIREEKGEDPILMAAGSLSGKPISAEEIEEKLYGK